MAKRRRRQQRSALPARRDPRQPARGTGATSPVRRPLPAAAAPEFISLTYTLPYHLIGQVDDVAVDSNRSASEVIADAIRLYLRTCVARREQTRISTVEGFSYQHVAVAETLVDDPASRASEAEMYVDGDGEWEEEDWDDETDRTDEINDSDDEEWEEDDWEEDEDEDWSDDSASDVVESAAAAESDGHSRAPDSVEPVTPEQPASAPATAAHVTSPPAPEPVPVPESRVEEASRAAAPGHVSVATQVDAQAGEQANELAEGEPQPALDTIVDPAAEVRRRLRKISSERLGSSTMRAVLGDIMQEVDVKDFSPADHSQRVAELARQLGRACGLQGAQLLQLEVAALAHDIGKASVPTDILEKRRPSPEEMAVIRKYPEFGADLISIVPQLQPLAPLVGAHQERWNGSGYPDGLQGNDIPVGAQIVALCDVYNVLTTERRYRPAYDEERARQIVRQNIGALWNPEIARIFLRDVIGEEDAESPQTGRPS